MNDSGENGKLSQMTSLPSGGDWEEVKPKTLPSGGDWEEVKPKTLPSGGDWEEVKPVKDKPKASRVEGNFEKFSSNFESAYESTLKGVWDKQEFSGLQRKKEINKLREQMQSDPKFFDRYPNFDSNSLDRLDKQADQLMRGYKDFRMAEIKAQIDDPTKMWYEERGLGNKLHSGATALAGQVAGNIMSLSPENLLPIGRGRNLLATIGKGALQGMPTAALQELLSQQVDIELDLIKNYDWGKIAEAAGVGGATGAIFNAATNPGQIVKAITDAFKARGRNPELRSKIEPTLELKSTGQDKGPQILDLVLDQPKKDLVKKPFPEINWYDRAEFDVENPAMSPFTDTFQPAVDPNTPLPRLDGLNVEPTPASYVGDKRTVPPKLKKEFITEEPPPPDNVAGEFPPIGEGFGPDVETTKAGSPYMTREQIDQANVDNAMGGSKTDPMAAGTHQLDELTYGNDMGRLSGSKPESSPSDLRQAFLEESRNPTRLQGLDNSPMPTTAAEYLRMSQELADQIPFESFEARQAFLNESHQRTILPDVDNTAKTSPVRAPVSDPSTQRFFFEAKSLREAIFRLLHATGLTDDQIKIGKAILASAHNHSLEILSQAGWERTKEIYAQTTGKRLTGLDVEAAGKDPQGVHKLDTAGDQQILLRDSNWRDGTPGFEAETLLHEGVHGVTERAFMIAEHPVLREKYPEATAYVAEIEAIRRAVVAWLVQNGKKHVLQHEAFKDLGEFNAYGLTHQPLIDILKQVSMGEKQETTAWARFMQAIKKLMGVDVSETAYSKLFDASSQWKEINSRITKEDAGAATWAHLFEKARKAGDVEAMRELMKLKHKDRTPAAVSKAMFGKDASQESLNKIVSPYPPTADGMRQALDAAGDTDLGYRGSFLAGNAFPVNQFKNFVKHPVVTQMFTTMRHIYSLGHIYAKGMEESFHPYTKATREIQLNIMQGMIKLQSKEYQSLMVNRGMLHADDDMLRAVGITPKGIEIVKQIRPAMAALLDNDLQSAAREKRTFPTNVRDYWPLSHGGEFIVEVRDPAGNLTRVHGFDSQSMASRFAAELSKAPEEAGNAITAGRRRAAEDSHSDFYNDWALGRNIPEYAKVIQERLERNRATEEMAFELARSGVKGALGEVVYPDVPLPFGNAKTYFNENSRALAVLHHRIRASKDFYIRSLINERIIDPFLNNLADRREAGKTDLPELYGFTMNWLNDLLGYNIAWTKNNLDKFFQMNLEMGAELFRAKDFPTTGPAISQNAARRTAQNLSFAASLAALSGNMANGVANLLNFPMTALWVGPGHAARLGADPVQTFAWHSQALAATFHGFLHDRQQWAFLRQMHREGYIHPHIFDDTPVVRDDSGLLAFPVNVGDRAFRIHVGKVMNWISSQGIEMVNNFLHLSYYYNLVKIAEQRGKLQFETPFQRTQHIVELARDATGDYAEYSRRLINQKMGSLGALTSNFDRWKWNQLGREINNLKRAFEETKDVGIWEAAAPTLALVTLGTAYMGLRNAPGFQDYENIRQMLKKVAGIEMKPADQALKDIGVPEEFRGSFMLETMLPALAETDREEAIDLSGSQSFAAMTNLPTVTLNFIHDVLTLGQWGFKSMFTDMPKREGALLAKGSTLEEEVALKNAVPRSLQPFFLTKEKTNDPDMPYAVQGKYGREYGQTPFESKLNMTGLMTTRQTRERREQFNAAWMKKDLEGKIKTLKDEYVHAHALQNFDLAEKKRAELIKLNTRLLDAEVALGLHLREKNKRVLTLEQELQLEILKSQEPANTKALIERLQNITK